MPKVSKEVKGHRVEIDDDDNLSVAGKEIDYQHDSAAKKWSSNYLPYSQYDSLEDLADAIATHTEEFKAPEE